MLGGSKMSGNTPDSPPNQGRFPLLQTLGAGVCQPEPFSSHSRFFLDLRWKVLHELINGFGQVLLLLLRLSVGVNSFCYQASPDQVMLRGIVHVNR